MIRFFSMVVFALALQSSGAGAQQMTCPIGKQPVLWLGSGTRAARVECRLPVHTVLTVTTQCVSFSAGVTLCNDGRVTIQPGVKPDVAAKKFLEEIKRRWPEVACTSKVKR